MPYLKVGVWSIHAGGIRGTLRVSEIDELGRVSGTLFDEPITGWWSERARRLAFVRERRGTNAFDGQGFEERVGKIEPEKIAVTVGRRHHRARRGRAHERSDRAAADVRPHRTEVSATARLAMLSTGPASRIEAPQSPASSGKRPPARIKGSQPSGRLCGRQVGEDGSVGAVDAANASVRVQQLERAVSALAEEDPVPADRVDEGREFLRAVVAARLQRG